MTENNETALQVCEYSLRQRTATLPEKIVNLQQYEDWCGAMVLAKRHIEIVTNHYAPLKKRAHDAHKEICNAETRDMKTAKEIDALGRRLTSEWATAERDRQAREQAAAEEAARKAAETKRQADAQMLVAAGFDADAVVVTETPVEAVAIAPPPPPKVAGVGMVDEWTWEVTDLAAVRRECLIVNEKMLDYKAKTEKGAAQEPGIRFFSRLVPRNRG